MISVRNPAADASSKTVTDTSDASLWFMLSRAYANIYGLPFPTCATYRKTISDAANSVLRDGRTDHFSDRERLQIFEDIIRISDEHTRLAAQHSSRASNPVYLRETALDNAIEKAKYLRAIGQKAPSDSVIAAQQITATTRLEISATHHAQSGVDIVELAYQQILSKQPTNSN
jgi:hypothetical protein